MPPGREKAADEVFCQSCGSAIKKEAEICPECGVRNEEHRGTTSSTGGSGGGGHDPAAYDTTVSDTWWYGVAGGTVVWALLSLVAGQLSGPGFGFVVLVAWIGLPLAAYFDMQYVRANSEWNPNTALWVVVLAVFVVNVVAGAVYLYRRHEVLGEP